MTKKIWVAVLWGLSCAAQEREPDFFNERTIIVGVEENIVLQTKTSLEAISHETLNEKREEKGILVDGEKKASVSPSAVQFTPQYARSAWGGKTSSSNLDAVGWSVPATFMNTKMPSRPLL